MPHGRPLRYWAKASLFRIPFIKQILDSSGALPVHRRRHIRSNPPSPTGRGRNKDNIHDTLFEETVVALSRGETIGVFPEGTSYTLPRIVQVKEGAARAALGYIRWRVGDTPNDPQVLSSMISIVPVGIVYTDKSHYRSRLSVR